MAKKIGTKGNPQSGEKVRGVATTMQILLGFAPKTPPPNRSMINAFGGDVDAARSRQLDSAHYGELLT